MRNHVECVAREWEAEGARARASSVAAAGAPPFEDVRQLVLCTIAEHDEHASGFVTVSGLQRALIEQLSFPLDAAEVAKRVASRATRAELDCYRGRDAAARGRLSYDAARARWAAEGFARGEALACCATRAAGRRASSGACSVETEIDPAWLPPPRANALIPDADG